MFKCVKIIILDPNYYMYYDMVLQFQYFLDQHKIKNDIVDYSSTLYNDDYTQCVFFGTRYNTIIPKGSVLTNFDNIKILPDIIPEDLAKENIILDYSNKNIKEYYNVVSPQTKTFLFSFGYTPKLDFGVYPENEKIIDICFLGNLSSRRKKFIDYLLSRNSYYCYLGYNRYLNDRADLYKKSKIILSIYSSDDILDYSGGSRIFPAVCTGGFVIAEKCKDESINKMLEKICINVNYDELEETIKKYISYNSRKELTKTFYENIQKMIAVT